jgi:tetratricopeptide (TPR) repeat protein
MSAIPPAKRVVRYFLSYAHDDEKLPAKLLKELDKQLRACKDFEFQRWQDTDILPGEKWHEEIMAAARQCDFGLLLVSPAFLGSDYIGKNELPLFVGGEKPSIPVGLCRIDFKDHDTKGLEESQIFVHTTPRTRKYFADCSAKVAAEFAHALFGKIIERLKKLHESRKADTPPRPAAVSATLNNLPRIASFFGRQQQLGTIAKALLPQTRTWGVLIDGPGGMGKTTLAIRAAEIAASQFTRVLFVSTKVQKLTPGGVVALSNSIVPAYPAMLSEIAVLLGLPHIGDRPAEERPALIKKAIHSDKMLLILDNLENLDKPQQDLLFEFVSDLPAGSKAIVTSRRRTDVDARIIRLAKLEQDAALAFLEELAEGRDLLARATRDERLHLYEETGGNPLLLRWIVGQLGRGGCRTIANSIELCRKASTENDPLEFIFGDLLETFTDTETKILAALSYFNREMEVKFVAKVAGISKVAAQTALSDLANRALVIPDEADEKFLLVPMVADFLRRKRPEAVIETGNRLENHAYAIIVENGYQDYDSFSTLDNAWPTVAPAIPLFVAGANSRLQEVCDALTDFLNFTGRWDERLSLNQQSESKAVAANDLENAGWRACHAGFVHFLRGQSDEVLNCAMRAMDHWRASKSEPREIATALRLKGVAHDMKEDHTAAIAAFSEALDLFRTLSVESIDVAMVLNDIADSKRISGDLLGSELDFKEALRVSRAVGHDQGIATYTANLAILELDRNRWAEAEALSREALPVSEKLGRKELVAGIYRSLAKALVRQGKADEALLYALRAVEIYEKLGHHNLASARVTLAECKN